MKCACVLKRKLRLMNTREWLITTNLIAVLIDKLFRLTLRLGKDEIARTKRGIARKMSDVRPLFPPLVKLQRNMVHLQTGF